VRGRGRPGPAYWQNRASYRCARRCTRTRTALDGAATIVYRNNSPDTLHNLHLDLTQNFHAPGSVRFEEAEVTGGMELRRVAVDQQAMARRAGAALRRLRHALVILPPQPVPPGEREHRHRLVLPIPQAGAGERMGYGEDLFFLAYWYPHMAVYDDVVGWHPDPFVGTTEFYHGFAATT
jgi:hypothetical protein